MATKSTTVTDIYSLCSKKKTRIKSISGTTEFTTERLRAKSLNSSESYAIASIDVDINKLNAKIGNGTLESITINYNCRCNVNEGGFTLPTVKSGYINSSNTEKWEKTYTNGVGSQQGGAISRTDTYSASCKSSDGTYHFLIGIWNEIALTYVDWAEVKGISLTLTYTPIHTLTVTAGTGGTVTGGGPYSDGSTATLTATPNAGYKFVKWSDGNTSATRSVTVTGAATYTATFEKLTYTVTFKNGDGTTLEVVTVNHGDTPKCSKTPTKATTAEYTYTFSGWTPALGAATANQVYTPNFTATKRSYRVRWFNEDGTLLETDTTLYGVMPTYDGATPTKTATAEFTYTFKGWHITVATVTGEIDYYARYTETPNKYKVTWKNEDGTVLEEDETEYGKIPTYDSSTPTKAATDKYTYSFAGWDTVVSEVTGDIVYTATYTEHIRSYTLRVSYREAEGSIIGVVNGSYEYDTPLVATAQPKPGYRLLYWVITSVDGTEITKTDNPLPFGIYCDTILGAVFERVPIPFKVNLERVTGVYAVPSTKTIVYVISGTVPTVETKADTVDEWHFLVSNTVPENSYPLKKVIVNGTRLY